MLVLSSFVVGTLFGGTLVRFHAETVGLALSRISISIQDELVASPSFVGDSRSSREGCHCEVEESREEEENVDVGSICEANNYIKNDFSGISLLCEQNDFVRKDELDIPEICEANDYVQKESTIKVLPEPKIRTAYAEMLRHTNGKKMPPRPTTTSHVRRTSASTGTTYVFKPPERNVQWCPTTRCKTTELCQPCQRRFLILLTTARSASTTLTWMFDTLPGVRMSGENANTLAFLKRLMDNVLKNPNFKQSAGAKASWGHHFVPPQSLSCVSQAMIEGINPPELINRLHIRNITAAANDIVGFKTIRFFHEAETPEDEKAIILFLKENFPCSRVVVNINSNITQYVQSVKKAWKSFSNKTDYAEVIQKQNAQLRKVVQLLGPQRSFLLDKSEWTQNITKLNEAVSWLGFDPACHFTDLLEFNTKGSGYGNTKTKLEKFGSQCKRLD